MTPETKPYYARIILNEARIRAWTEEPRRFARIRRNR